MSDPLLMINSVIAVVCRTLGTTASTSDVERGEPVTRDRGAVSIEQVLWYAAAAVSVAVVAAIIWSQIRETASTPVQSPSAP